LELEISLRPIYKIASKGDKYKNKVTRYVNSGFMNENCTAYVRMSVVTVVL